MLTSSAAPPDDFATIAGVPHAAAIRQLVEDRPLRDELGARARAGYEQRYTKEEHLAAYLSQIDDILQDKR